MQSTQVFRSSHSFSIDFRAFLIPVYIYCVNHECCDCGISGFDYGLFGGNMQTLEGMLIISLLKFSAPGQPYHLKAYLFVAQLATSQTIWSLKQCRSILKFFEFPFKWSNTWIHLTYDISKAPKTAGRWGSPIYIAQYFVDWSTGSLFVCSNCHERFDFFAFMSIFIWSWEEKRRKNIVSNTLTSRIS